MGSGEGPGGRGWNRRIGGCGAFGSRERTRAAGGRDPGRAAPAAATEGLAQLSEGITRELTDSQESAEVAAVESEAVAVEETPVAEIAAQEPQAGEMPTPRSADQAVDIPLKIFTPSKPGPVEGAGALIKLPVFLPGHTGLPLRPKMGLAAASGSGAGSKKSGQRPVVAQAPAESKAADVKQDTKPEAKQDPKAEAPAKSATPATAPNAKPWGKPTAPPSPKEGAAKGESVAPKMQPAPSVKITPPAPKPREEDKPKTPAVAEKIAAEKAPVEKIAAEKTGAEKAAEPAPAPKPKAAAAVADSQSAPVEIEAPSFGSQAGNASFLSTLKGKLVIGGVAAVLCLGAYFVFGGKSPAPAPNPTAAADKARAQHHYG